MKDSFVLHPPFNQKCPEFFFIYVQDPRSRILPFRSSVQQCKTPFILNPQLITWLCLGLLDQQLLITLAMLTNQSGASKECDIGPDGEREKFISGNKCIESFETCFQYLRQRVDDS